MRKNVTVHSSTAILPSCSINSLPGIKRNQVKNKRTPSKKYYGPVRLSRTHQVDTQKIFSDQYLSGFCVCIYTHTLHTRRGMQQWLSLVPLYEADKMLLFGFKVTHAQVRELLQRILHGIRRNANTTFSGRNCFTLSLNSRRIPANKNVDFFLLVSFQFELSIN